MGGISMNRDIKEFQKRFERWKAGENYWKDIRGIDLFDDGKDDTNDDNNTWTKQGYAYIGNNDNGEPMYLKDSGVITNIIEREHPDGNLTYHYRTDNREVPLQKMGDGLFYYEKEDGSTDYFDVNRAKAYRQWQKEGGPAKDIDKVALGIMSLPLAGGLAAEAVAAAPALAPGSAFWTNPMTQGVFASELGGRAWDAANVALTGNTWVQNLSKDIHRYTGWNPQESWGGQFLTEASNPGYFTPYSMAERGINAATNGARKALDMWNSPLTGKWTTIPEVNWDADYWFKTISGRRLYSAEEAAELASNVPEYRAIEKKLYNEGKLISDPNGNIKVKDSDMSPQEYIMRQSKAFQKMNPDHHYTGVSKKLRYNFENGERDPNGRNTYNVWTDRKSPENVREYAVSKEGGYTPEDRILNEEHMMLIRDENLELHKEQLEWKLKHGKISQENYEQNIKLLEKNYIEEQQKSLSVIEAFKKEGRFNGGAVYDVTYPIDAVETPIINAEGARWYSIPFENVVRDAPSVISHYPFFYNRQVTADGLVMASRRNGYGVTHIDNLNDSHNGELLNETIIGIDTPVKSVLGNTGNFDTTGPNKWKLYRSIIPPFLIGGTAYGLSNKDGKRIKSRKYKNK